MPRTDEETRPGRAARAAAWALAALAALGAGAGLTFKDRWPLLAAVFYALPPPVVAALLAALAGLLRFRIKRRRPALMALALAAAALVWWLAGSFFLRGGAPPPPGVKTTRLLLWNACRGNLGIKRTAEIAAARGADLVVIVEHGDEEARFHQAWRKAMPGMSATFPGRRMAFFSKEKVRCGRPQELDEGSYALRARVRVSGRPVSVILADIRSRVLQHRGPAIARLGELIRRTPAGEPLLVLGDFNTPRSSALLAPLRAELSNAFEVAGRGLDATWPVPLPVHGIDQVWTGRGLGAARCRHLFTAASDHRQVLVDLWAEPLPPKEAEPVAKPEPESFTFMTWNIQNGRDRGPGANGWPARKGPLAAALTSEKPEILCVQEALTGQLRFIEKTLPGHGRAGAGRDDGGEKGEHSAILYDRERFELLAGGDFWLSDTPERPSRTWGNRYTRICSWVRLRDKASGRAFRVYSTHFPLLAPARERSAKLIAARLKGAGGEPVLVAGDFNCGPGSAPWRVFEKGGLADAAALAGGRPGAATFHKLGLPLVCLDAVFCSAGWKAEGHRVLTGASGGRHPSDHFAVRVALRPAE